MFYICRIYIYIYIEREREFLSCVRFIIVISQIRVTVTTNGRAVTRWMNVSYTVGRERPSSLLLQCIVLLHVIIDYISIRICKM
jgi:hypothetical protein